MEHLTKPDHDYTCGKVLLLDDNESRIDYLRSVLEFVDYSMHVLTDIDRAEELLQAESCYTAIILTPAMSDQECHKLVQLLDGIDNAPTLFIVHEERNPWNPPPLSYWCPG